MVDWRWPAEYPPNCPPLEAVPSDGTFYRVVATDPPTSRDFLSLRQQNPVRAERIVARSGNRCILAGLSVFTDINDAISVSQQHPKLGRHIARLSPSSESGKVLRNGRRHVSHHTWWHVVDYDPVAIAVVVH